MKRIALSTILITVVGLIIGLTIGNLLSVPLKNLPFDWAWLLATAATFASAILLTWFLLSRKSFIVKSFENYLGLLPHVLRLIQQTALRQSSKPKEQKLPKGRGLILDTSAIIDGRIADIARSGFLDGYFIVPTCVLKELQRIADSKNYLKRNRGRRGLEILEDIKKSKDLPVKIIEVSIKDASEIDGTLIKLAERFKAKIVTTDYNLNKVGKVSGVKVLNVNELANMVKTVILPGEQLDIQIIQKGKEETQGVGYLPDGTMVVIENGNELIGQEVETVVERLYQTEAGRMIFVKPQ